jgi:hypothetical protein
MPFFMPITLFGAAAMFSCCPARDDRDANLYRLFINEAFLGGRNLFYFASKF